MSNGERPQSAGQTVPASDQQQDEKPAAAGGAAAGGPLPPLPGRDRHRESPVIDAKPEDIRDETPKEPAPSQGPAGDGATQDGVRPPEPTPSPRQGGTAGNLVSGAAGALVALAGASGYVWWTKPDAAKIAAEQSTRIETAIAAQSARERTVMEARLKSESEAAAKQASAMGSALAALSQRIAAVEQIAGQAAGVASETKDELARRATAAPSAPAPQIDLRPMEARLLAIETRLRAAETAIAAAKTEVRVTQTQDRDIAPPAVSTPVPVPVPAAPPVDLSPLIARITALEERLAPLASRIEPIEKRLAPVETKFAPMEAAIEKARTDAASATQNTGALRARADAAAASVIARGIGEALATGAAFEHLLKGAQGLGVNRAQLDALAPFAAKGAPDGATLLKSMLAIERKIPVRQSAAPQEEGWLEKLKRNVMQQVQIRPIDSSGQSAPSSALAAIAAQLRRNDYTQALALAQKLPDVARKPLDGWIAQLRQVEAAHKAQKDMLAFALARLTQEPAQ